MRYRYLSRQCNLGDTFYYQLSDESKGTPNRSDRRGLTCLASDLRQLAIAITPRQRDDNSQVVLPVEFLLGEKHEV